MAIPSDCKSDAYGFGGSSPPLPIKEHIIEHGQRVKLNFSYTRIINDSMKQWMEENKDRVFIVEKTYQDDVKLYKVDFWITEDLLLAQ